MEFSIQEYVPFAKLRNPVLPDRVHATGEVPNRIQGKVFVVKLEDGKGTDASGNKALDKSKGNTIQGDAPDDPILPDRVDATGEVPKRKKGKVCSVALAAGTGTKASGNRALAPSKGTVIKTDDLENPILPDRVDATGEVPLRKKGEVLEGKLKPGIGVLASGNRALAPSEGIPIEFIIEEIDAVLTPIFNAAAQKANKDSSPAPAKETPQASKDPAAADSNSSPASSPSANDSPASSPAADSSASASPAADSSTSNNPASDSSASSSPATNDPKSVLGAPSASAASQATSNQPTTSAKPDACCTIVVEVQCEHNRKPGPDRTLAVVPKARIERVNELKLSGFTYKSTGSTLGWDTITVKATRTKESGSTCDCEPEIVVDGYESFQSKKEEFTFEAKPNQNVPFWFRKVTPTRYNINVRGCKKSVPQHTILCYPASRAVVSIEFETWRKQWEKFEKFIKLIAKTINGEVPEFKYLMGSIKGEWGWEEAENHEAHYSCDISAGFDPLIAFDNVIIKGSVANWIPAAIRKYAADIFAYIKLEGGIAGTGFWRTLPFKPNTETRWECGGRINTNLKITLGIEATAGSQKITKIKISVGARLQAEISAKTEFIVNMDYGPGLKFSAEWDGLSGEIYANVKGDGWFEFFDYTTSTKLNIIKGGPIFDGSPWYPFSKESSVT